MSQPKVIWCPDCKRFRRRSNGRFVAATEIAIAGSAWVAKGMVERAARRSLARQSVGAVIAPRTAPLAIPLESWAQGEDRRRERRLKDRARRDRNRRVKHESAVVAWGYRA